MTCIVGITNGTTVTIGADSAGVSGWDLMTRADKKVWASRGWVFGFTDSFRMGQLLRHALDIPKVEGDLDRFMATTFVDAVRQTLKDGGYATKTAEAEQGGTFLVGTRGRLFRVCSDYQIAEPSEPFDAVGCGAPYALGALHAQPASRPMSRRVRESLAVAAACSAGVSGPFHTAAVKQIPTM